MEFWLVRYWMLPSYAGVLQVLEGPRPCPRICSQLLTCSVLELNSSFRVSLFQGYLVSNFNAIHNFNSFLLQSLYNHRFRALGNHRGLLFYPQYQLCLRNSLFWDVVACACSPSCSGGWGTMITWTWAENGILSQKRKPKPFLFNKQPFAVCGGAAHFSVTLQWVVPLPPAFAYRAVQAMLGLILQHGHSFTLCT